MTSPPNRPTNIAMDRKDTAGMLETFFKLLDQLTKEKAIEAIHTICNENNSLKEKLKNRDDQLKEMEVEKRLTWKTIGDIQKEGRIMEEKVETLENQMSENQEKLNKSEQEVDSLTKKQEADKLEMKRTKERKKSLEDLKGKLEQEKRNQAEKLDKSIGDLKTAQATLDEIQKKYQRDSKELANLRSKAFRLKEVAREGRAALTEQIGAIFEEAYTLAQKFFGQSDIDTRAFKNQGWPNLVKDDRIRGIPMPSTNSTAARQMRVASIIRLLAAIASEHIFQPVYLTEDGVEVSKLIEDLYDSDLSQAQWLRRVLLNTNRQHQQEHGRRRADTVVEQVCQSVEFLMHPSDLSEFHTALSQWCNNVLDLWMKLQQIGGMVHSISIPQIDDDTDWRFWTPLSTLPFTRNQSGKQENGKPSSGSKQAKEMKKKNFAAQVWPAFLVIEEDGNQWVLKRGYVLTESQVEEAAQEVRAEAKAAALVPSRSRRKERSKSHLGNIPIEFPNESTENLSFLGENR